MFCPADRPIGHIPFTGPELCRIDLRQNAFVKKACNVGHIGRDHRIGRLQTCVTASGIGQAQRQPHLVKSCFYGKDLIGSEVHVYTGPQRACQLIHQPAWLAEVLIFRLLCQSCDHDGLQFSIVVVSVENLSHQHRECSGRGQPRPCRQIAGNDRIESADIQAEILHCRSNTADQRSCCSEFLRFNLQISQTDLVFAKSFGLDPNDIVIVLCAVGGKAGVYGSGNNSSLLMIGMISCQLCAAGSKENITHFLPFFPFLVR